METRRIITVFFATTFILLTGCTTGPADKNDPSLHQRSALRTQDPFDAMDREAAGKDREQAKSQAESDKTKLHLP